MTLYLTLHYKRFLFTLFLQITASGSSKSTVISAFALFLAPPSSWPFSSMTWKHFCSILSQKNIFLYCFWYEDCICESKWRMVKWFRRICPDERRNVLYVKGPSCSFLCFVFLFVIPLEPRYFMHHCNNFSSCLCGLWELTCNDFNRLHLCHRRSNYDIKHVRKLYAIPGDPAGQFLIRIVCLVWGASVEHVQLIKDVCVFC